MLVGILSWPSSITCQIPPGTPEKWPLNCPKLGYPLSKSKSFHPVFIKLGEYIGGHNISTKFYNLPNPPTPELWPLNCPKTELAVYALQVEYLAPKNVVITIEYTTNTPGFFLSVWHTCFYLKKNSTHAVLDEPFWLHNASKHAFLMLHLRKVNVYSMTKYFLALTKSWQRAILIYNCNGVKGGNI